jgi:GH15 family glucan-1,4-alpha-glucosidase
MSALIEDYAIVGDTQTVALIDKRGSVDWWCVPRIDSGACFASLLGDDGNGRWLIRPKGEITRSTRRYLPDTLILETVYETPTGTVAVHDFMLPDHAHPTLFRMVEGRSGTVEMELELVVRFDYGSVVPWVTRTGDGLTMVAGPDALRFHSPVPLQGMDHSTRAEFTVGEDQYRNFSLGWYSSQRDAPMPLEARGARQHTSDWWRAWAARCTYTGPWRDDVVRSLITLKALTYAPTGALCAAATTSLPEEIGGVRNWDYRYSWLRDTSFALQALVRNGYGEEAAAWNEWLRRAVAGSPGDFQIMYDVEGRRRLTEIELDWLSGYEGSRPVRVGNAAHDQFQLDVYGEILDAALIGAKAGLEREHRRSHDLLRPAMAHLDTVWNTPDEGIWEVRGPRRHFTHSKVMAWVAYDRAVQLAELLGDDSLPVEHWAQVRDEIHAQVCEKGWSEEKNSFVQYYGADHLDASLLMLARVGFLPAEDPRIVGTIEAIERELLVDGFVLRYPTEPVVEAHDGDEKRTVDGLPPGEGAFLMTTFWLADNLAMIGRSDDALALFERLRALQNDVGLLAEEYDPVAERMLGNFPQAFSHLALVVTAMTLCDDVESPSAPGH